MSPALVDGVLLYGVLLVSLVCHEASHALFALAGGDRTAYMTGQVTLNPVPHIRREPFGTVFLPIGMLYMSGGTMCMGFAHAPYDGVWAYHHPRRAALMSLAGPLANFFLVLIALGIMKVLILNGAAETYNFQDPRMMLRTTDGAREGTVYALIRICSVFVLLNTVLGVLNMIPIPPFDGGGVVEGFFPTTRGLYQLIRENWMIQLGLVIGVLIAFMEYRQYTWVPALRLFYSLL